MSALRGRGFPKVGIAFICGVLIVVVSIWGGGDGLTSWQRSVLTAASSIFGVIAGWALSERDSQLRQRGAVRAATAYLFGLGVQLDTLAKHVSDQHIGVMNRTFKNISAVQDSIDGHLAGVEVQLRSCVIQVEASIEAWRAVEPEVVEDVLAKKGVLPADEGSPARGTDRNG